MSSPGEAEAWLRPQGFSSPTAPGHAGRKIHLTSHILDAPGDLFLGSDPVWAQAQGPRRFHTVAKAIRFAIEHAAPISMRGAALHVHGERLGPSQIRSLYRHLSQGR